MTLGGCIISKRLMRLFNLQALSICFKFYWRKSFLHYFLKPRWPHRWKPQTLKINFLNLFIFKLKPPSRPEFPKLNDSISISIRGWFPQYALKISPNKKKSDAFLFLFSFFFLGRNLPFCLRRVTLKTYHGLLITVHLSFLNPYFAFQYGLL